MNNPGGKTGKDPGMERGKGPHVQTILNSRKVVNFSGNKWGAFGVIF